MTKKSAVMLLAVFAIAATAAAQMTGGPGMGGGMTGGGMGSHFGTRGSGMPQMNLGNMQGMQMTLPVAGDGTAFVARKSAAGYEIAAIRPSGAVGWTWPVSNLNVASMEIAGTNLVVAYHAVPTGTTPTLAGKVVALSIASGSQQWVLDLDGFAMALEGHDGGIYALVVKPTFQPGTGTGMGQMNMTRALVGIGNDGKVTFSMPLN